MKIQKTHAHNGARKVSNAKLFYKNKFKDSEFDFGSQKYRELLHVMLMVSLMIIAVLMSIVTSLASGEWF